MENEKPKRKREKTEELPSDPAALEQWQNLPQGAPSREAMPPATGGIPNVLKYLFPRGLLCILVIVAVLSLLAAILAKVL